MNRAEYSARWTAASERVAKASTAQGCMVAVALVAALVLRAFFHLCVGFGGVAMADLSVWWGFPLALVSGQTLGRVWSWWRRDARIADIEAAADIAEKQAGSPK